MKERFAIKLAEKNFILTTNYMYTRELCKNYITELSCGYEIIIEQSDIDYEREKSAQDDRKLGNLIRKFSDEYLESLAVYRKIADALLDNDTILFHGSVVAVDEEGYLFTAKSGTGKSTHTKLWREYFGNRAIMVNDDKPLLRITDNKVYAYGTPWDGKHHLSKNIQVPLKAICILERGQDNRIKSITKKEALPMLLQQTNRPKDVKLMADTMRLVDELGDKVKLYHLQCNMELDACRVAYDGMNNL